jgi:hypothetical protein
MSTKNNSNTKSENTKSTKTPTAKAIKTVKPVAKGPGRPKYIPAWPTKKEWTFVDFMVANGIDAVTKKGGKCTILTLRKYLDADMYSETGNARSSSEVIMVKGKLGEPTVPSGLGRKPLIYTLRAKVNAVKTATVKAKKASEVSVPVGTSTQTYEAKKAELLGETPAPVTETVEVPAEKTETPVTA